MHEKNIPILRNDPNVQGVTDNDLYTLSIQDHFTQLFNQIDIAFSLTIRIFK